MRKLIVLLLTILAVLLGYAFGSGVIEVNLKEEKVTKEIEEKEESEKVTGEEEENEDEPSDERAELMLSNVRDIYDPSVPEECFMDDFNYDDPNTTVVLSLPENGVEFEIPYNENWGNDEYSVAPYEFVGTKILYGQMTCVGMEGTPDWFRFYELELRPYMNVDEVMFKIVEDTFASPDYLVEPEVAGYGELEGVRYIRDGLCGGGGVEVVGEDNNYFITRVCMMDTSQLEDVEEVAKSIKLI